VFDIRLV